jgi:hypothetical protein
LSPGCIDLVARVTYMTEATSSDPSQSNVRTINPDKRRISTPLTKLLRQCHELRGAIWLYLWANDKTTLEVKQGNLRLGAVLGLSPVKDSRIAADLSVDEKTIRSWRRTLVRLDLLRQHRTPTGYQLIVVDTMRWPQTCPSEAIPHWASGPFPAPPEKITRTDIFPERPEEMPDQSGENVPSNKTVIGTVIIDSEHSLYPPQRGTALAPPLSASTHGAKAGPPEPRSLTRSPEELLRIWQEHCGSLPGVRGFSAERRKKSKARIESHAEDLDKFLWEFREAVIKAAATPFLCGGGSMGWRADFDWFVANDTHYLRVLEGKYDGSTSRASRNLQAAHAFLQRTDR